MMGFWFIVSIVAAAIIRKPGAALAVGSAGRPGGGFARQPGGAAAARRRALVQGAGAEAVFAVTRWRDYRLPVLMAAGVGAAVFSFVYTWIRFDYGALAPGALVLPCSSCAA